LMTNPDQKIRPVNMTSAGRPVAKESDPRVARIERVQEYIDDLGIVRGGLGVGVAG